jgi:hypothetical protein
MVRMAIKPKQILDTAVNLGRAAVSAAERRLRGDDRTPPSTPGEPAVTRSPSSVGAAEPGKPGGPKSGTAAKPRKAKPAKRRATAAAAKRGATGTAGDGTAKTPPKVEGSAGPQDAVEEGKAKAVGDKTSTPRKRATGRRSTASRAAASSGQEVADAASGKDD